MKNSLHLFDLDFTLWKLNSKLAVIDKTSPKNILYRISVEEKIFMKDKYKKFNHEINYNGEIWYLNDIIWDDIQKIKNISEENIGITFREFTDEEILNKQIDRTEYLLDNLNHLKNQRNIEIGFITASLNRESHQKNIDVLSEKIERKLRIKPSKIYFINDIDNNENSDITSFRKSKIILEFLTGKKTKNDRFIDLIQDDYNDVYFYDDDSKNIDFAKNIQTLLESFLLKTEYDTKKEIIDSIKDNDKKLFTYQMTNNKVDPFIINENKLFSPLHIKVFEDFTKK